MTELSRCRSCNAPIRWVVTAKGRFMPLDPDPVEDGTFQLHEGEVGIAVDRVEYVGENALYVPQRYKSHFSTCPYARQNRKGAARAAAAAARERVLKGVS